MATVGVKGLHVRLVKRIKDRLRELRRVLFCWAWCIDYERTHIRTDYGGRTGEHLSTD